MARDETPLQPIDFPQGRPPCVPLIFKLGPGLVILGGEITTGLVTPCWCLSTSPFQLSVGWGNTTDDSTWYQTVREMRWPTGVIGPKCAAAHVLKQGRDHTPPFRQKYLCKHGSSHFDDLTDTSFAGHHQSLCMWILCLYFLGLTLAKQQMAHEFDLHTEDVQQLTTQLREGIVKKSQRVNSVGQETVLKLMAWPGIRSILKRSGHTGGRDNGIGSEGPGGAARWPATNRRWWAGCNAREK